MRFAVPFAVLALTACSSEPGEQERQAAVAEVEANQTPSPETLVLEPITYPDIEENNLFGAGCSFAPDGGGVGAVAIAMAEDGYLKRNGEVLKFAADSGSRELPYLARREYDGTAYSFTLDIDDASGAPSGMESSDYSGSLTVRDAYEAVVYEATGIVQCGA